MLVYVQRTGSLYKNRLKVTTCYSGFGIGLNNPDLEHIKEVGPIVCGDFDIGEPADTDSHGPFVMKLIPRASTNTFGRDHFLCHGDSVEFPGQHRASHGCVIASKPIRVDINKDPDRFLRVVADEEFVKAAFDRDEPKPLTQARATGDTLAH